MFYSVNEKWAEDLRSNFLVIKNELSYFLQTNSTNIDSSYASYAGNMGWKTIPLIFFTIKTDLLHFFPETKKIILNIPELIGAEFSILKPNTEVKAHYGYSKQVMRTHLGLKIPQGNLGFMCEEIIAEWKAGDTFSFNDGMLHKAWNKSTEDRWVLLIDTPIPKSIYSAFDISKYKLENLTDEVLLNIASKETWLEWFNKQN